ncbi:uncharacterized protein N7484_011213 [Penicillium longicatenatum]|uniref:uncharacterized protein n=1 Tax=Penicillium longicatenatum TaxID=1561947 RepID=UPI00254728AB|nr:uncharacterized protein N7484_011213 [Penicillium longicatenatum]KAJ5631113.1 hypothetical protein N7484_011213 [Penicillium longicatenatum]KAJ5659702.1 hypothetical protein N7507_006153 [Penicillium longicatenatum]
MSFFESCKDVHIEIKEDGPFLVCYARDQYGSYPQAIMRLDEFIGNDDGHFIWDGVNFSQSAKDIRLEGSNLTAVLANKDGRMGDRQSIDLNKYIANEGGDLVR